MYRLLKNITSGKSKKIDRNYNFYEKLKKIYKPHKGRYFYPIELCVFHRRENTFLKILKTS